MSVVSPSMSPQNVGYRHAQGLSVVVVVDSGSSVVVDSESGGQRQVVVVCEVVVDPALVVVTAAVVVVASEQPSEVKDQLFADALHSQVQRPAQSDGINGDGVVVVGLGPLSTRGSTQTH